MSDDQYLTEKHYLVCDKGTYPLRMVVSSQTFTRMSGYLAATKEDTMKKKVFLCTGKVAFAAGVVAGLCCLGIENLPHYEKVYNFDIEDNKNYYVTEEGLFSP